ncbi:MAG: AIPR family protein [Desulfuromonadales bacterium]
MKKTILHEAEKFFAYNNNGIAATASHAEVVQRGSGLYLTTAADLQIVNGGQTTASLSTTRNKEKADLSNIFCTDEVIYCYIRSCRGNDSKYIKICK